MRLAVVGAGPAGLATLRALTARGFDAVAFERRPCIGGVWALHDDERPTAAYRSLHLITSRDRTEYGEFAMPEGRPTTRAATPWGATSRPTPRSLG